MNRRLAHTLASCGSTLQASEPESIVKAAVVRSMAPACGESAGMTSFISGAKSQRLPKRSRSAKGAYAASRANIALTSGSNFFRKGGCFSMLSTNAASRATGEFFGGALAWPPLERAVKRTSAFPFSNTPSMAKFP